MRRATLYFILMIKLGWINFAEGPFGGLSSQQLNFVNVHKSWSTLNIANFSL